MSKHSQKKTPRRTGRRLLTALAALLIPAALAAGLGAFSRAFPRLELAGYRISREEYLSAMYQARSDVLSDHAAAGISLTDWHKETALGDPVALTRDRALEILNEAYAVSTLAVERGYLADAGYEAAKRDLEDLNRQRQEALASGGMVTGLPQFTMADYLHYRASGLRLQFCSDPGNPENQVTQEELRQRYEADRDALYQQPDSLELAFLSVSGADGDREAALQALHRAALQTGSLAAAMADFPQLKPYYQEVSVGPENYAYYDRAISDIMACAAELQSGDISPVIRREDWLCLIQCTERTVHRYIPLEDVQSVVTQSIRESRYDGLIARRMETCRIRVDLQALYRFTAAQL